MSSLALHHPAKKPTPSRTRSATRPAATTSAATKQADLEKQADEMLANLRIRGEALTARLDTLLDRLT